jgi:hypothetical protein
MRKIRFVALFPEPKTKKRERRKGERVKVGFELVLPQSAQRPL